MIRIYGKSVLLLDHVRIYAFQVYNTSTECTNCALQHCCNNTQNIRVLKCAWKLDGNGDKTTNPFEYIIIYQLYLWDVNTLLIISFENNCIEWTTKSLPSINDPNAEKRMFHAFQNFNISNVLNSFSVDIERNETIICDNQMFRFFTWNVVIF